jgi:hypothetical protein
MKICDDAAILSHLPWSAVALLDSSHGSFRDERLLSQPSAQIAHGGLCYPSRRFHHRAYLQVLCDGIAEIARLCHIGASRMNPPSAGALHR